MRAARRGRVQRPIWCAVPSQREEPDAAAPPEENSAEAQRVEEDATIGRARNESSFSPFGDRQPNDEPQPHEFRRRCVPGGRAVRHLVDRHDLSAPEKKHGRAGCREVPRVQGVWEPLGLHVTGAGEHRLFHQKAETLFGEWAAPPVGMAGRAHEGI